MMIFIRSLSLFALIGAVLFSQSATARDNFVTSPTAPYPPGCTSSDNRGISTPTQSRQVYADDAIQLTDAAGGSDISVNVLIYRQGCIEDNRSVMRVTFENFTTNRLFALPEIVLFVNDTAYPMRLVPEANTFETNNSGLIYSLGTFDFVVDGPTESSVTSNTQIISPEQYSGAVTMIIRDALDSSNEYSVPLPLWNTEIKPSRYPLNGRLSGTWVSADAADQGFLIAFNELVSESGAEQQVFFSWYTFDQNGDQLWLVTNALFPINAAAVEMPLQLVTNGSFLGEAVADRETISTAILTAISCNELELEYDLTSLGLGEGTLTLIRTFALETAGYACRDVQARLDAK